MAWGVDTTNTVTATGRRAGRDGKIVSAIDRRRGLGGRGRFDLPIVRHRAVRHGRQSNDSHVTLPTNNAPCAVTFSVRVCNNSVSGCGKRRRERARLRHLRAV